MYIQIMDDLVAKYFHILVLSSFACLLPACKNTPASQCGDQIEDIHEEPLGSLPDALTRIAYGAEPTYDLSYLPTEYRLLEGPNWLQIDEENGALWGTPQEEDAHAAQHVRIATCSDNDTRVWSGTFRVEMNAKYRNHSGYDAYAHTYDGESRKLRDDLQGDLHAEIQFVQSHASAPSGNHIVNEDDQTQSIYMPSITAQREALLLFLPHQDEPPETVHVILRMQDEVINTRLMRHPNDLPAADNATPWNVHYSKRAWSTRLPYDLVREGLSLEFVTNQGAKDTQRGELSAHHLDFSPASQLLFRTLRLGMLTHVDENTDHFTLDDPILAATDYFQTLPVSKLIMASYANAELDRVMVSSGVIYDVHSEGASATYGDVYSGDMRENVGKSQVSAGINLANIGVSSHDMSQSYPHGFKQITNHHAWGMYTDVVNDVSTPQRVKHGLSGGNGIGTIISSRGNEASHEWGHAYGLGHYPGQTLTEDGRWAEHHADSGWGFIQHRNRLRHGITGVNEGALSYNQDAMSGGTASSPLSVYTYYTGFSARIIQADIAQFPVPSSDSPTGYVTWDDERGAYTPHHSELRVPQEIGVPVTTLVGGYDPTTQKAVIYPALFGNYGNTFEPIAPDFTAEDDVCWLDVRTTDGHTAQFALSGVRYQADNANQFHVNLPAEPAPEHATLSCRLSGQEHILDDRALETTRPELPPAAIVGEEHGSQQLQERELEEIEHALEHLNDTDAVALAFDLVLKIDGLPLDVLEDTLSGHAWTIVQTYLQQREASENVEALLNYGEVHALDTDAHQQRIQAQLDASGFVSADSSFALPGSPFIVDNRFISHTPTEAGVLHTVPVDEDSDGDLWVMDTQGKIHSVASPWLCISTSGDQLTLEDCSPTRPDQRWEHVAETQGLKNLSRQLCVDFDRAGDRLILYRCHGNWNQQWAFDAHAPDLWLATLSAEPLQQLLTLFD